MIARGSDLINQPQTLGALQNPFILIHCSEIYPYYAYILLREKANALEVVAIT